MDKIASELVKIAKELVAGDVEVNLPFDLKKGPSGIFLRVETVGYNGREWWWVGELGLKSSYRDESRFRYELSQELMSQSKAIWIMNKVRDEYDRTNKVAYGYHKTYSGDPYWMILKYPGHCDKCHKPLQRGERAFYYPRDRKMFGESCGHGDEADRDFHSMVEQEEGHLIDY